MTKDEIKNRISMELRDPILQQGFEIICKENSELEKRDEQLAKAKEIIRAYMLYCKGETHKYKEAEKQAEQFLSELEKNERR